MSWSFTKAIRRGAAGPPAAGDTITIEFENPDDPINHNRSQQWTYDGTTNWGQFVSMVQHETNAYVKHLNVQPVEVDVTEEFTPAEQQVQRVRTVNPPQLRTLHLLPKADTSPRVGTRCTATTQAGNPCTNFATHGTDPPRCSSHGGRV